MHATCAGGGGPGHSRPLSLLHSARHSPVQTQVGPGGGVVLGGGSPGRWIHSPDGSVCWKQGDVGLTTVLLLRRAAESRHRFGWRT